MLRSIKIKDFMTKNVVTLSPEMELLSATKAILKTGASGAPVLDKHGRLVGILTLRDCMRVALQAYYHGAPGGLVKERMSPDPESVDPEQSILTLAEMFINGRYHRYPVVDNGRLVGVISRRNVMEALARHYPT